MSRSPSKGILMAVLLAVGLHAILFVLLKPNMYADLGGMAVPPNTSFLSSGHGTSPMTGTEVRTVASPVLFSLPSNIGFSRELAVNDVQTRLTFAQEVKPEQFLDARVVRGSGELEPKELMLTSLMAAGPDIPGEVFETEQNKPSGRRVTLAPELMSRMVGGVVLPAELNQDVSKAWEVRAEVSVSEQGAVKHVFLAQPLESPEMNQSILKLLHGLQFSSGEAVEGTVEIYSPETQVEAEVEK